jgi:2-polyprenyl-3-methyl-5-hydroxy-6-metoxy-1,4-benzoquinol methylase
MYEFHKNKSKYFEMTYWVADQHVIPFIGNAFKSGMKVCEIGCGEAGVLKAFLDKGATGIGIELMENRAELAKLNLSKEIQGNKVQIINKDIYDIDPVKDVDLKFDLIVLKDVIEHIPNQEVFIKKLHDLLLPGGKVFFGYPPWQMPFGGHQQCCSNKFLAKLPWFHLLPTFVYKFILNTFGESQAAVKELLEVKETGISTDKMHRLIDENGFKVIKQTYWLINPIYIKKFNFKPLKSIVNIPYIRNFYVTAHYVLFEKN